MSEMIFKELKIRGAYEVTGERHEDERGFFCRTYDKKIFKANKLDREWVQESHSFSKKKGTVRGLHFQLPPHAEAKLVRAARGEIFLVIVDLRRDSKTFGKWESLVLSENSMKLLYVPRGCALGMCTLADDCILLYKIDAYYVPESQRVIKWNDPDIGIPWPVRDPILSERDSEAEGFKEFAEKYGGLDVEDDAT
jgi:dTDP-4-dehydrorhamnose 3,5-epimerase